MRKVELDVTEPQRKFVVIAKLTLKQDYRYGFDDNIPPKQIFEFAEPQEISKAEYDTLFSYIKNQNEYCNPRYIMIEKVDVKSQEVINIFEEIKYKAEKAKKEELAREISNKKRKETLAKKAEERKRKQLAKLKKALGELT